ncbi:hypothetical protein EKO23_01685 [Nocardioides guangzhouensis]|uniref:Sensor domain-containing protein n=1 Tax=Nocardioides guangzhouensis TaxID=2497878 RepID=A0A4Q4ZL18_9ACTN|nr:hypothetical protein [Nocardioides guangzhouensis]RYP88625.1 hypothetical protein EKO23_01685 [Nocardioides guangzhouensis]
MHARALAVAAPLLLTLAACSGAGVMGPPGAPGPGSSQEFGPHRVQQALLDRDDVGGPFDEVDNDSNDGGVDTYDATLGCVTSLDVLDNKANDPADAARSFAVESTSAARVGTAVISYRSADVADRAMDDLASGLERCTPIDIDDEDGHWQLEPTTDEDGWADADRQINIGLAGTLTNANIRSRVGLQASAVQVAQNVVYVVLMDATDDFGDYPRELTEAAVARLRAVAADEEPPEPRQVMEDYEPGDFGVPA